MRNKYILIVLFYLFQCIGVMAIDYMPSDSTNIQTTNTLFTGTIIEETKNNKLYAYFGIPYAQPPVGELRWKAPRDLNKYEEKRLALKRPNRCPQLAGTIDSIEEGFTVGEIIGSEDCLYLNVFVSIFSKIYSYKTSKFSHIDLVILKYEEFFWINKAMNPI